MGNDNNPFLFSLLHKFAVDGAAPEYRVGLFPSPCEALIGAGSLMWDVDLNYLLCRLRARLSVVRLTSLRN